MTHYIASHALPRKPKRDIALNIRGARGPKPGQSLDLYVSLGATPCWGDIDRAGVSLGMWPQPDAPACIETSTVMVISSTYTSGK
jgi:hypothetical protein